MKTLHSSQDRRSVCIPIHENLILPQRIHMEKTYNSKYWRVLTEMSSHFSLLQKQAENINRNSSIHYLVETLLCISSLR